MLSIDKRIDPYNHHPIKYNIPKECSHAPLCQRRHYWLVFLLWGLHWMESHSMCSTVPGFLFQSDAGVPHVAFLWLRVFHGWTHHCSCIHSLRGKTLSFPSLSIIQKCLWTFQVRCGNTITSRILSCCLTASVLCEGQKWNGILLALTRFSSLPLIWCPILFENVLFDSTLRQHHPQPPTMSLTWKWKADT